MRRVALVMGEALWSVRAHWVASLAACAVVAGMCASVIVTHGAVAATRAEIVATLDSQEARSIIVRAGPDAGIDSSVLDRVAGLVSVEAAVGLGAAVDVTNSAVPGGERVGMREAYGLESLLPSIDQPLPGSVYVSPLAADGLGLDTGVGAVTSGTEDFPVVATVPLPVVLDFLEPAALLPRTPDNAKALVTLVLLCDKAESVAAVTTALVPLLDAATQSAFTVETAGALVELTDAIAAQTSPAFRGITAGVFAVAALLVSLLLTVLVTLRRRDFGRRRALGASQGYVISLVVAQGLILSVVGAAVGCAGAVVASIVLGRPTPPIGYVVAVAVLATCAGCLSSVLPAVVAARRDPVRELRLP